MSKICLSLFLLIFGASGAVFAEAVKLAPFQAPDVPDFKPVLLKDLPDFMAEVSKKVRKDGEVNPSGLVSTINYGRFEDREPSVKELKRKIKKNITGFKKDLEVRLFLQKGKAPLAVTLLGFDQSSKDHVARAWQAYLFESGCHVLSFDSVVRNKMNSVSNHGVAGNYIEEGKVIASIINGALKLKLSGRKYLKDRITSVRLLGASWGGLLAQQVLRQSAAKQWPVDRCLLLSTPVNVLSASQLLDQFHNGDRRKFSLADLAKLSKGYTPKSSVPTEEENSLMRAGIGYVFHGDLVSIAKSNMRRYRKGLPKILKRLMEDEDWELAIDNWDFYQYIYFLGRPYWDVNKVNQFPTSMPTLLEGCPNFVQAFIACDDPLCRPEEIKSAAKKLEPPLFNVLPHGGHLGYAGTKWVRVLIKKYFGIEKKK